MSVTTDVMFLPFDSINEESDAMKKLLAWDAPQLGRLPDDERPFLNPIEELIEEAAAGGKVWCAPVYVGTWNYLPWLDLIGFVQGLEWPVPSWVLWIDLEHFDRPIVVTAGGER